MTIKTIFVGINRYLDPAISELGGVRRDTIALWALCTDTIERLAECNGGDGTSRLRPKPGIRGATL